MDRKNNQIDAQKMTLENLEKHNETYVKKLRVFSNQQLEKSKRIEDIKQMEVEDLSTK